MSAAAGVVPRDRGSHAAPAEVSYLKLETGGCGTTLDSSLRCAPFRMTKDEGAAFRMAE